MDGLLDVILKKKSHVLRKMQQDLQEFKTDLNKSVWHDISGIGGHCYV